ncbi:hypothetical protein C2G38_2110815 [Gigaspora rosea]|uniref:Uncharacterized protein n=1 Tax=Gigaspora rosea TaxID=44941 RepID=A0A397UHK5_9GLOM|nr:hypothetical protein C2G38_2110815 [Gigaspora rosea]
MSRKFKLGHIMTVVCSKTFHNDRKLLCSCYYIKHFLAELLYNFDYAFSNNF